MKQYTSFCVKTKINITAFIYFYLITHGLLISRSEAEIQYSKNLAKLSNKLTRACRDGVGGLNDAWRAVAIEMESRAEVHRLLGAAILEDSAKPLRTLTENQHRARKQAESVVDKSARNLSDWRTAEAKSKKHSHACARENEKLQDAMLENRYACYLSN